MTLVIFDKRKLAVHLMVKNFSKEETYKVISTILRI